MVNMTGGVAGMLPKVSATGLMNGVMIFCAVVIVLAIIGWFVIYWFKKRKYNEYRVVIWEKDTTGNTHESYAKAGVFVDKATRLKLLFIDGIKKGMNPNSVPFVSARNKKGKLIKTIYLRKTGVSNYVFCHVKLNEEGVMFTVGEEDVNWAAQDIERVRRSFLKEGLLQKFAPYIMFIVTILIVMIILISLFNKMGVISEASANMVLVSEKQLEITQLLQNLTNQTNKFQQTIPVITIPNQVGG